MFRKIWDDITGETKRKAKRDRDAERKKVESARQREIRKQKKEIAKQEAEKREQSKMASMSPKELATYKKEPWVDVLLVKVDPKDVRYGFFELDWNDVFVDLLIKQGYGLEFDKHEEIVDRWFRELCQNTMNSEEKPVEVNTGHLDIKQVLKDNT